MERSSHVMLIGEGASKFGVEMGMPRVDSSSLVMPEAKEEWKTFTSFNNVVSEVFNKTDKVEALGHDTVGAVAMDLKGNFAAATSTGGIPLQKVGRASDASIIGAGAYCDSFGGVSCTGHGESIAKVLLAQRVLSRLQCNGSNSDSGGEVLSLHNAMKEGLKCMLERVGGRGGIIGICRSGEIAKCTSTYMSWASVDAEGIRENGTGIGLDNTVSM